MTDAFVIVVLILALFAAAVALVLWCAIAYSGRLSEDERLPPPNVRASRKRLGGEYE